MTELTTEILNQVNKLDDASFEAQFSLGTGGRINGLSSRDIPLDQAMLRQPKSNEKDIRVTIPSSLMVRWKPSAWENAGVKGKKIQLFHNNARPGLLALRAVAPNYLGPGVYRLEQNAEDGQTRFMTTRSYTRRILNETIELVPLKLAGEIALLDLTGLKVFGE